MSATIDWLCAEVPRELIPADESLIMFYATCAELWDEIRAEVTDEHYLNRQHNLCSTYDAGCHGPLCRKALRERPNKRSLGMREPREEREFDPIIEYFYTVIKHRLRKFHRALLEEVS